MELPNGRMHYASEGPDDAPILLLSNSLGTDLSMWNSQMPALVRRFRVLRYDTRGHGASATAPASSTLAGHGQDVIDLLDHLGGQRAHFCGLSMGGMIGTWLAARAPSYIDRLLLCGTAARVGPPDLWTKRIAAVRSGGMGAIADAILARWFTTGFLEQSPSAVAEARRVLTHTSADGYCRCCIAIRDADLTEDVSLVTAPTLVIVGTHDSATPPSDSQFLASRIPGAGYLELDAAHLVNMEAPRAFTDAVLRFLMNEEQTRSPDRGRG